MSTQSTTRFPGKSSFREQATVNLAQAHFVTRCFPRVKYVTRFGTLRTSCSTIEELSLHFDPHYQVLYDRGPYVVCRGAILV